MKKESIPEEAAEQPEKIKHELAELRKEAEEMTVS